MTIVSARSDLALNQEVFRNASEELRQSQGDLSELIMRIVNTFEPLRTDWDTEAGRKFMREVDTLSNHLRDYTQVLQHISDNLRIARDRYEEVFTAADAVANSQF